MKAKIYAVGNYAAIGAYYTIAATSEEEVRQIFKEHNIKQRLCKADYCCSNPWKCKKDDCSSCKYLMIEEMGEYMSHENC